MDGLTSKHSFFWQIVVDSPLPPEIQAFDGVLLLSALIDIHPHHKILMTTEPHKPGCHTWRQTSTSMRQEVQELNPDVIVECYLDAKYYHYDPVELIDLADINATFANLVNEDYIASVEEIVVDEHNACVSVEENIKELDNVCPPWGKNAEMINPKRLEHHQSGHLVKDKTCPVCIEESANRVAHWREKGHRQTGVIHLDLAAFEPSADGHKYCLVAAVTVDVDKVSKFLPILVPMRKKDAVSGLAAIKEALTLCNDRNLRQITGSRITRFQADCGGELNKKTQRPLF